VNHVQPANTDPVFDRLVTESERFELVVVDDGVLGSRDPGDLPVGWSELW
jgi:hypothetical protein